jgi:HEAT repeat protein
VDALDDPTEIVRFHAAMALGNVHEPRAIPTLLLALVVKSPTYHYGNAAACLSRMGDPASIAPLLGLLGHASAEGRLNAVRSLVRMREPRVVEALLPLLDDPDASVRAATVRTLGFLQAPPPGELSPNEVLLPRNEQIETRLPALLRDDDAAVREAAAGTLGRVGGAPAADQLAKLAADPFARVRIAAGAGLLRLGDARGVALIEQALADPNREQREQSATAVASAALEEGALVPALARNLYDPAHNVRVSAISSLGRIANGAAAEALLEKAKDREFLTAVIGALGRIRDPRAAEAVVRHLADHDPRVRAAAATALGEPGGAGAPAGLIACLSDPATEVRLAAILALTKRKAREALGALTTLAKDDPHAGVRTAAERAVRRIER